MAAVWLLFLGQGERSNLHPTRRLPAELPAGLVVFMPRWCPTHFTVALASRPALFCVSPLPAVFSDATEDAHTRPELSLG